MEIVDACWDAPRPDEYIREDVYFGSTIQVNQIVDYRRRGTVYNQFINEDTKMACWSYGLIHWDNIQEILSGGSESNPRSHWLSFVAAYKTDRYDPIVAWSSLQDQLEFATKVWVIGGFYKVTTKEEIMEWLSKMYIPYTWSGNIDREATKYSPDNVCVIKKWSPKHIVCSDGWDYEYMFIRNSWSLKRMKLRWEDLVHLFSTYMIVPKVDAHIFDRVKARRARLKETHEYLFLKSTSILPKWVNKNAERKAIGGKVNILHEWKWYEIVK